MLRYTRVVLIPKSHCFSKYRDLIHDILVFQHNANFLPEFMSRLLFIEVVVQAHVDEASNVCRRVQVHHIPSQCIYLVWSSISKLHRLPQILDHQHVPHLRHPHLVVGVDELEHVIEWIYHFLSFV